MSSENDRDYPWTLDPDGPLSMPTDIAPPPWMNPGEVDEADRELDGIIAMRIMRWAGTVQMTPEQVHVVFSVARAAACYGWAAAMRNGPMSHQKAAKVAVAARKADAEERRKRILAAYEEAAKAGGAIDIDKLADALGVHRSTVYRNLHPD